MALGLAPEHEEMARTLRRWLESHCPASVPRASFEGPATELPAVWKELADQGWLGLHVPEEHGGQGFGLLEVAVLLEECGRAMFPGPLLATVLVSAVAGLSGAEDRLLRGLADGSLPAGVHLGPGCLHAEPGPAGGRRLSGVLRPVLGAPTARLLLLPTDEGYCLLERDLDGVRVEELAALDPTRALGEVRLEGAVVGPGQVLDGRTTPLVRDLATVLAAAEATGGARWCLETTSAYAKDRVQFGRPIGQFQAVKHALADTLVRCEQSDAAVWDAALSWGEDHGEAGATAAGGDQRALAAAVAGAVALEGFVSAAKTTVQLLGGIGFTWEHDAHLYLRRALATRQLLGAEGQFCQRIFELARAGVRRSLSADLPPEAEGIRRVVAPLVDEVAGVEKEDRRPALVRTGLLTPHWPAPWGRDASPLEQLVIDQELARAGLRRPSLSVGAWAAPTLIAHGTAEQQERWVGPTLRGEIEWCQLFSEPGAGSDLASLSTRATRVEGGWSLTGQKVWTSMAQQAHWAICLARTDPGAPKHQGITYFIVDMKSPGLDVRPLRELTGQSLFNEVFLDDVFVPDDAVVGRPGEGWGIARTTLANERVFMSSGATFGMSAESVLRQLDALGEAAPPGAALEVGALLAEAQSVALLGHRATLRSLSGVDPGASASVRKLLGAEHEQRLQELGLALCGPDGAVNDGEAAGWANGFLFTRCLTIAGGTSQIQRNVLAERLLGLPKDPEPGS